MKNIFKKGISMILAATLVLCLTPAVSATETAPTYEYVFTMGALGKDTGSVYTVANAVTAGAKYTDATLNHSWAPKDALLAKSAAFLPNGLRLSVDPAVPTRYPLGKNCVLIEFTVPETGIYKPQFSYFEHAGGSWANVYISTTAKGSTTSKAYVAAVTGVDGTDPNAVLLGSFNTFNSDCAVECEKDPITITPQGDGIYLEKNTPCYFVLSIDGEKTKGTYTTQPGAYYCHLQGFTLTEVSAPEPSENTEVSGNVSFVATSNVGSGELMKVEADGFTYDELVDSIPAGTSVKVTAPEKEGYEFKHWVRGSRDNGVYVSDKSSYSFTALTNTFLTAVYEKTVIADGIAAVVEFYNGNGQYLEKATSTIGGTAALPETSPSLTGFVFANVWETEDGEFTADTVLSRALTRAVAKYNESADTFKVTDNNGDVHNLKYGEEIKLTSDSDVYWLRDGTVVDYGTSYTYAAWDDTVITTSATGERKPLIVLDSDAKNGARMIEYDDGGKKLVEVGIIFGASADIEIGSCSSKATSQENVAHGQFTARPNGDEAYARGYLIYEEDGAYKVIYSK